MKNAMKKLLSLMLVAVLLVSAVPFKAFADEVVNVHVTVYNTDGEVLNDKKTLPVTEDIALDKAAAQKVITNWTNREYDHWESSTSGALPDGKVLTYDWLKNEAPADYSLSVYVKETVPATTESTPPATTEATPKEPVSVPVSVYINGEKVNTSKTLTVEEDGVKLTKELAMSLIRDQSNRTFVEWRNNSGDVVTDKTLSYDWAKKDGYSLRIYLKETVATEPTETKPAETEPAPTEPEIDDSVDVVVGNGDKRILVTLDWNVTGMKDNYVRVTDPNTKMGTVMEAIQKSGLIPTRTNYTFAGWYWNDDFDYPVKDNEYVTDSSTTNLRIYARWTRNASADNVFLKIYLNGKTSSPAKIVDISSYGDADGSIDIYEAKRAAGNYYSSTGYDGLFTDATWNGGAYNNSDQTDSVAVNANGDTFIYIMLWGAKTTSTSSSSSSSSSGTADTSNPKTGDTVYMVMTVMGLSAAALAAVYYVSKKRAF